MCRSGDLTDPDPASFKKPFPAPHLLSSLLSLIRDCKYNTETVKIYQEKPVVVNPISTGVINNC
jgi:hypothetical protein